MDKMDIGLISVIMPAYNAEKYIEEAINSVIHQTYSNWELIIVDDCSKDGTACKIRPFLEDSRISYLKNESNRGVSFTRKRAVEAAKGEWVAFLDSDDVWCSEKLEKQVSKQIEKKADLLFTGSGFMDEDSNTIDWKLHVPEQVSFKKLLKQNLISNSSVLTRKDLYLSHCVIGDDMHEDFACWLNMLKAGCKATGIDEPLLIYRVSSNSKSGNKIKAAKMNWKTYRYCGLSVISAGYNMIHYAVNGLKKYRSIKSTIAR